MNKIGIIANPASGKDIRRLVSHATTIDNNEKVNIVERIVLSAEAFGVKDILIMPDTFQIGYKVLDNLNTLGELSTNLQIMNMKVRGSIDDTINAAKLMEEYGVDCLVVLGGDGTSRAVAKSINKTPIISISTGTNNVYPEMLEGTVVGMAAAFVASQKFGLNNIYHRDKRIEIFKDGILVDIALVDSVISKNLFVGAKAIWDVEDMEKVIVTRAYPGTIGFSSLVGCRKIIEIEDDFGAVIDLTENKYKIIAPIAAGTIEKVHMGDTKIINLNEEYKFTSKEKGVIALDGEREISFKKGETFIFKITRKGPIRVNIKSALELAQAQGFFNI
ncbi:ATP-NAD kinase family protein [Clostridium botulinum]|uniref:Acetoin catabolism protein X n=1 Tax=Clostridium botulinum (strain Langeland / NCTC 10281 / Type F) TaxID=441772 RepID=A7GDV9_CLOBL|nr:NAD(+)/NADH kinase [Clostridium botulinum]ABS41769.1 acetoin catabolism protein X [Clostridium botulinum F str. Langeland]ADF99405.1 acetoin catabolism protein X [Clostridium botulinum F str. 230613]KKM43024.1 ATP-NAD kinase [Clostridium botulinum]MBY6791462.1 NAD(+)/NADH kinase [Clostridium botulinum]MBY6936693.1 NAD(+)/NADH kinase [Clostridium botulinum]